MLCTVIANMLTQSALGAMSRENQRLVADEPVEFEK